MIKSHLNPLENVINKVDNVDVPSVKEIYKILTDETYEKSIPYEIIKQYKTKVEKNTKLDKYSALIVSKYLNDDAIKKLNMVCKKFGGTLETLHFNPFPVTNKKTRELFPNMETQYIYSKDDMIFTDGKIKKYQIESHNCVIEHYSFCNWQPNIREIHISPSARVIEDQAFCLDKKLKCIYIPKTVKSIKENVFAMCTNLESVIIPEDSNLTELGPCTFAECIHLKSIVIPSKVKKIEACTFLGCSMLDSVTLGQNTESIEKEAFSGCKKLKSIVIPSKVEKIGKNAFDGCNDGLELIFKDGICKNLKIESNKNTKIVVKYKGNLSDYLKNEFTQAFKEVKFVKI